MSRAQSTPRLTDPGEVEEHLRAAVDSRHLGTATALVICCDSDARPLAHFHVLDCDADASPSECAAVLDELIVGAADEQEPAVGGLVLGLTRQGGDQVQPYDRSWFRALYRVCHRHGLIAFGVYTLTRAGARAVHIDDAA